MQTAIVTQLMPGTRRRTITYVGRKEFALRCEPKLYQLLQRSCIRANMTATTYLSTLLELSVLEPLPASVAAWAEKIEVSGERVHVTLRISPSLHRSLKRAAKAAGLSMNLYTSCVLAEALSR